MRGYALAYELGAVGSGSVGGYNRARGLGPGGDTTTNLLAMFGTSLLELFFIPPTSPSSKSGSHKRGVKAQKATAD